MSLNRKLSQQLFIVSISRESMHKHNFGQTLKLQSAVVTLRILFWLQTMLLCKFGGETPTGSEERAQKRLILQKN